MNLLKQSALAWKEITEYRYLLTYGYKKKLYPINLTFSPEDYPHLAGFQYMKDISLPNYTSAKIVDRILDDKISFEKIQEAISAPILQPFYWTSFPKIKMILTLIKSSLPVFWVSFLYPYTPSSISRFCTDYPRVVPIEQRL